jgi:hypothetical protein
MKALRIIALLALAPTLWIALPKTHSSSSSVGSAFTSTAPAAKVRKSAAPAAASVKSQASHSKEAAAVVATSAKLAELISLHDQQPEKFVAATVAAWPQLSPFQRSQIDSLDHAPLTAELIRSMHGQPDSEAAVGELLAALECSKSADLAQSLLSLADSVPTEQLAEIALNNQFDRSPQRSETYAQVMRNPSSSAAQRIIAIYGLAGSQQSTPLRKASQLAHNAPLLAHIHQALQMAPVQ